MSAATTAPERWLAKMPPEAVREELRHVFGVEMEGQRWAVATDGRTMLASRTTRRFPATTRNMAAILSREGDVIGAGKVSERTLVSFAGDVEWPAVGQCDDCGGTGKTREPHECDCIHCDLTNGYDEISCSNCEEYGTKVKEPERRPGWIGPVAIDRVLLARALSAWEPRAETAFALSAVPQVIGPSVRLDAGDVRVIIMGLVPSHVPPDSPRLEMQEVAA
jgi:hypothetical protein